MIKKVCFLVNYNQYGAKRHFTQKLAEAMNRAGVETDLIDVNEAPIDSTIIDRIVDGRPDFTASFNSFTPFPDNTFLWDFTEIPHLSMLLDPSIYSVDLIESPYSIISCVDQSDCFGLSTQQFDRIVFMPHAVERDLFEAPEQEKEYDVVFIGSCYDYETLRSSWKNQISEIERTVLEEAANIFLSHIEASLQESLASAWANKGTPGQEVNFLRLFSFLDHYTRGFDRVKLIRNIDAEVHVFGDAFEENPVAGRGWKELLRGRENVVFHDAVNYAEGLKIMQRSKICLNSSPFFKFGFHERILSGLACGALSVTNENPLMLETFKSGEEIVYYRSKEWEKVNPKIKEYLENHEAREQIVSAGREKVRRIHTWDQRVKMLLEVMPLLIQKCREKAAHA